MTKWIIAIIVIIAVVIVGVLAHSFLRVPEAASGPIEAVPIATEPEQQVPSQEEATDVAQPTEVLKATATSVPASEDVGFTEGTAEPVEEMAESGQQASAGPTVFEIVSTESEARFLIDEVLRGSRKTVIGATDQVGGADLSRSG